MLPGQPMRFGHLQLIILLYHLPACGKLARSAPLQLQLPLCSVLSLY